MASAQNPDPWYISLLGLAESFRTSNPPNIRLCVHCLQSIFNFKPPPRIEARTHLQLGNILLSHTKNLDLARQHLEKAVGLLVDYLSLTDALPCTEYCDKRTPYVEDYRFSNEPHKSILFYFQNHFKTKILL